MIPVAEEVGEIYEEEEIELAEEISQRVGECDALSRMVQCLTVVDLIITGLFSLFLSKYFIIASLFLPIGYWGAKKFDKYYLFIYFQYVFAINVARIYFTIKIKHNDDQNMKLLYNIFLTVCAVFGSWLLYALYIFLRKLIKLTEVELKELRYISEHL